MSGGRARMIYRESWHGSAAAPSLNQVVTLSHRRESQRGSDNEAKKLEEEVSAWPSISVHPHRFGGREFRFGSAEVGHMHAGEVVDIPFPRSVRDTLLAERLAEEHRWVPNSGWVTFQMRSEEDLSHALWLMRLSYLRYALKSLFTKTSSLAGCGKTPFELTKRQGSAT
jgi:hypothetical protein